MGIYTEILVTFVKHHPCNLSQVDEKKLISCDSTGTIRIWDFYIPVLAAESKQSDVIQALVLHESELQHATSEEENADLDNPFDEKS